MEDLKEAYAALQAKHGLPGFDELNNEFEIDDIEKSSFMLSKIRIRMTEKIDEYLKTLEGILQPEASLSSLYESKYVEDSVKERIYKVFKHLMLFFRWSTEAALENTDEASAAFIKGFYPEWMDMKHEMLKLIRTLRNCWTLETSIKEDLSYLG